MRRRSRLKALATGVCIQLSVIGATAPGADWCISSEAIIIKSNRLGELASRAWPREHQRKVLMLIEQKSKLVETYSWHTLSHSTFTPFTLQNAMKYIAFSYIYYCASYLHASSFWAPRVLSSFYIFWLHGYGANTENVISYVNVTHLKLTHTVISYSICT